MKISLKSADERPLFARIEIPAQRLSEKEFDQIISSIKGNILLKEIHVTASFLSEEQKQKLIKLTGKNKLKGLKITTAEGVNLGSVHTNWDTYSLEKRGAYKRGMHEVIDVAFSLFVQENGRTPFFILDFGAGTGQDTINLALNGCPLIWAVDADEESVNILKEDLKEASVPHQVECITSPFISLAVPEPAEFFVCSYTWPYRCPEDFPASWEKTVELVKIGGYIAGHFFGPRTDKPADPGITYHTEEELHALLEKNFEIVWARKDHEGTSCKLYGGDDPCWGDLFHIVAKRIR